MDFLTASYDPVKDVIYNCKQGSLTWWHEKKHQRQHKTGQIAAINNITNQLLIFTILFLAFDYRLQAAWCIGIYMLFYAYFEVDAWIFALKNRNKDPTVAS
jgi:hypothetical protein